MGTEIMKSIVHSVSLYLKGKRRSKACSCSLNHSMSTIIALIPRLVLGGVGKVAAAPTEEGMKRSVIQNPDSPLALRTGKPGTLPIMRAS